MNHAFPKNVVNVLGSNPSDDYRIVMAPYISEDAAKICKDLSMNCMILFEYIFISEAIQINILRIIRLLRYIILILEYTQ